MRLLLLMMIQDIFVVLYIFFLLLLKSFFAQKIFVSFDYWPVVCVTPYHLHQSNPSGLYLFVQEKIFVFFNCSNIHCFCMCNVKRTFQLLLPFRFFQLQSFRTLSLVFLYFCHSLNISSTLFTTCFFSLKGMLALTHTFITFSIVQWDARRTVFPSTQERIWGEGIGPWPPLWVARIV